MPTVYSAVTEPLAFHAPLRSVGVAKHGRGRELLLSVQGSARDVPHIYRWQQLPCPGALQAQLSTAGACRSGVELVSTDATLPPLRRGAAPGQEEALFMDGAGRPSGFCIPSSGAGGISLV